MNFRLSLSLIVLAIFCYPKMVWADTTFDLNATLTQTGVANPGTATLMGTLTFNASTGALSGLSIMFINPGTNAYDGMYNLNYFGGPTTGSTPTEYGFTGLLTPYQASLFLFLPTAAPLIGYAGGPICSVAFACFNSQNGTILDNSTVSVGGGSSSLPFVSTSYTVDSGTLTAETPEPSSLILLGTGLCAVVGLVRRGSIQEKIRI